MLSGMESLTKLKMLDLSNNRLTSIDSLKNCVALERLDLQNNLMKDTKSLERISSSLINLTNLYCQDFNGQNANPCCKANSYKPSIKKMFPELKALDGQRLNLN